MSLVSSTTELSKLLETGSSGNGQLTLHRTDVKCYLPEQPRVDLGDSHKLNDYLRKHLSTACLDRMAPYFWMGRVGTPFHGHISPLHHQAARMRSIVVVENPSLHLTWHECTIFIKPLPVYSLSAAFWTYLRHTDTELWRTAVGFLRTYSHLIQYERDFELAQGASMALVPKVDDQGNVITYDRFAQFIAPFESVGNEDVSRRYHYGELRISRLNQIAPLAGKWVFHYVEVSWLATLIKIATPFITLLLMLGTVLNAMQVGLTLEAVQIEAEGSKPWDSFNRFSERFYVLVMVLVAGVLLGACCLYLLLFLHDLQFAAKVIYRDRRSGKSAKNLSSGFV